MKTTFFNIVIIFFAFNLNAQDLKPTEAEALVNLRFKESTGVIYSNEKVVFKAEKTGKTWEKVTDEKGEVQILLPEGETYYIRVENIVKEKKYHQFKIPYADGAQTFGMELTYTPALNITLDNVYFDTNKSELRPESFAELDNLFLYLDRRKNVKAEIGGHTDNIGSSESNKKLSENRAKAVMNYLIKKGIDPARLTAVGYGDTDPIADNETEKGRQMNRRVEVNFEE